MSAVALEELLRRALDRLDRQEQRTESLEALMLRMAPTAEASVDRTPAPITQTPSITRQDTPAELPWPRRMLNPGREYGESSVPTHRTHVRVAPDVASITTDSVAPFDVIASLDDVVWSVSLDGQVVFFVGGGVDRTFGRSANQLRDRPGLWLDVVPREDRVLLEAALAGLPDTDLFTVEHRIETPQRKMRWVTTRGRLVRDRAGQPLRVDGVTRDVTTRVGTERALAAVLEGVGPASGPAFLDRLVEHLAAAFDARAAVVVVPDPAHPGRGRAAAAWCDGRAAEPFVFDATGSFVRDVFAGGASVIRATARDRFPDDELISRLRAEFVAAGPLTDAAGAVLGFLAIVDDRPARPDAPDARAVLRALAPRAAVEVGRPIGERRDRDLEARLHEAEARATAAIERFREARRLEGVGRVAAGVAHDFNNLLTVIAGHAELVRDGLPDPSPLREPADVIVSAAHSAAGFTRQLLGFARPSPTDPCVLDLSAAVRGMDRVLRRLVGDRVRLELDTAPRVCAVHADPGQVDQVLLNLVLNARDAIADGGTVAVRTADAVVEPGRPGWPTELPPGAYVALTVTDTGCGMTDAVKARMFESFFTTKGDAGHGIGLATVREVVAESGGHIEVESTVGWGTSVRVYWPRPDAPASASHLGLRIVE